MTIVLTNNRIVEEEKTREITNGPIRLPIN